MDQQVLFDPRFLDQHAGTIVTDPTTALIELVANAWDAGAQRVEIDWPDESMSRSFQITDDGHGMTASQFERRWRTLAYDRTAHQGSMVEFPEDVDHPPSRQAFGRNGVGRHAAFYFGSEYEVETRRDGSQSRYLVTKGTAAPLEIEKLGTQEMDGHGTSVRTRGARSTGLSADWARAQIALRFLTDPSFHVFVDSTRVRFADVPEDQIDFETISIDGIGDITIRLLDTRTSDKTARLHGVAWHVKGRLVGDCSWHGTGHERFLDGRRAEAKRYTFVVGADMLAHAVRPDWSGFDENDPTYKTVNEAAQTRIEAWLLDLTKEKRAETARAVRAEHHHALSRIGPIGRERWEAFVERAQEECPSLSERDLSHLAGLLAKLELSNSQYSLIDRLEKLDPGQLDQLHDILGDWSVNTAKIVLDELKGRLKLLDQLREKVVDPRSDEVQELQPLFERGLWIFGPEFETIEYTSNEGMTRVIQKVFGKKDKGSRKRPDFVVLPDGSCGLYSYPRYDDDGGEIGTDRLVVVELKRPGVAIGGKEKQQAWGYVKELISKGHVTKATGTTCFVLGSKLEAVEASESTEWDSRVRIRPLTYDIVIRRAKSRLLNLYDKVREAPFLQDAEMDAFLDSSLETEPSLFDAATAT